MKETYLWQDADFPHFYCNEAVVEPLEAAFKENMKLLTKALSRKNTDVADVLTEEILANSEIEGVLLDRESVSSSFMNNLSALKEPEQGAVALTRTALHSFQEALSHERLLAMHRELMNGSDFPAESVGAYVGDMKIVRGHRLDREYEVVHEGASKGEVHDKMSEFIECYNNASTRSPLVNAVRGHIHFETIHPFCDGNGRIGRSLILMGLCRDFGRETPLALSRSFRSHLQIYYKQFQTGLDLTETIKVTAPVFNHAIAETMRILELTEFRTRVAASVHLHPRQRKVLHRLVDYELRDGFKGGMSNANYKKMAKVESRTALRDLNELLEMGFLAKTGKLKGTRYQLHTSDADSHAE